MPKARPTLKADIDQHASSPRSQKDALAARWIPGRAQTQRTQTTWYVFTLALMPELPLARFMTNAYLLSPEVDEADQKKLFIFESNIQLAVPAERIP